MEHTGNAQSGKTGLFITGTKIRIMAETESVESLVTLSKQLKGKQLDTFQTDYGAILELLHIPVHWEVLSALAQYWDDQLRCFTFPSFQITPTLEEYGGLLKMPMTEEAQIYLYPGHLPSKRVISQILGEDPSTIQICRRGTTEGLSRKYLEHRLEMLAGKGDWATFRRILALLVYGLVLFPSAVGVVDLAAISVFWAVENQRANPTPAILAETFLTLSYCHQAKGGKLKCCLQLLTMWILNHVYGRKYQLGTRYDKANHPIKDFNRREGSSLQRERLNRDGWEQIFSQKKAEDIWWKLAWWESEEIIYCCGEFQNIPLMSPRGCVNYNPAIAHRQFAYRQDIPTEDAVRPIYFRYGNQEDTALCQRIRDSWSQVIRKGRFELGKRLVATTAEYRSWLQARTEGVTVSFGPHNPLLGNNLQDVSEQLAKEVNSHKSKLKDLEEESEKYSQNLAQARNEYAVLQGDIAKIKKQKRCEESTELRLLKRENERLKAVVDDTRELVAENKTQLIKVTREKESLEKELAKAGSPDKWQRKVDILTKQLESKMSELVEVRGQYSTRIQGLIERLNQQVEITQQWETRYHDQTTEADLWKERCRRLVVLANGAIPEFMYAVAQAENATNPLNTPVEFYELLSLCNNIIEELRNVMM